MVQFGGRLADRMDCGRGLWKGRKRGRNGAPLGNLFEMACQEPPGGFCDNTHRPQRSALLAGAPATCVAARTLNWWAPGASSRPLMFFWAAGRWSQTRHSAFCVLSSFVLFPMIKRIQSQFPHDPVLPIEQHLKFQNHSPSTSFRFATT